MLGRDYELDGLVSRGDRLGHQIGVPTINLEPENELPPADGVYVTEIEIRSFGRRFQSVHQHRAPPDPLRGLHDDDRDVRPRLLVRRLRRPGPAVLPRPAARGAQVPVDDGPEGADPAGHRGDAGLLRETGRSARIEVRRAPGSMIPACAAHTAGRRSTRSASARSSAASSPGARPAAPSTPRSTSPTGATSPATSATSRTSARRTRSRCAHLKRLVDELAEGGLKSVRMSGGGDPLFHSGILDFLDHLDARGVLIDNLTTNGALLGPEIARRLVARGAREVIFSAERRGRRGLPPDDAGAARHVRPRPRRTSGASLAARGERGAAERRRAVSRGPGQLPRDSADVRPRAASSARTASSSRTWRRSRSAGSEREILLGPGRRARDRARTSRRSSAADKPDKRLQLAFPIGEWNVAARRDQAQARLRRPTARRLPDGAELP